MSLFSVLKSGSAELIFAVVFSRIFVVFFCLPVHETAHGWMANKMGDPTAKNLGRLTLNPFAHLDLIGTFMIFLFGIGYANPVPVNARNFKNPKKGMALTALAGPISNILMAFISICLYYLLLLIFPDYNRILFFILSFLNYSAIINATLAVFNLIPIPPLDGSKILALVIPSNVYFKYLKYERYVMIALLLLLFSGVLSTPISYLSSIMIKIISIIPQLIYGLLV